MAWVQNAIGAAVAFWAVKCEVFRCCLRYVVSNNLRWRHIQKSITLHFLGSASGVLWQCRALCLTQRQAQRHPFVTDGPEYRGCTDHANCASEKRCQGVAVHWRIPLRHYRLIVDIEAAKLLGRTPEVGLPLCRRACIAPGDYAASGYWCRPTPTLIQRAG